MQQQNLKTTKNFDWKLFTLSCVLPWKKNKSTILFFFSRLRQRYTKELVEWSLTLMMMVSCQLLELYWLTDGNIKTINFTAHKSHTLLLLCCSGAQFSSGALTCKSAQKIPVYDSSHVPLLITSTMSNITHAYYAQAFSVCVSSAKQCKFCYDFFQRLLHCFALFVCCDSSSSHLRHACVDMTVYVKQETSLDFEAFFYKSFV